MCGNNNVSAVLFYYAMLNVDAIPAIAHKTLMVSADKWKMQRHSVAVPFFLPQPRQVSTTPASQIWTDRRLFGLEEMYVAHRHRKRLSPLTETETLTELCPMSIRVIMLCETIAFYAAFLIRLLIIFICNRTSYFFQIFCLLVKMN